MIRIARLLLIITMAIALPTIASSKDRVIQVSTGEWPPFLSKNMKYYGVAARIISESFALEGIRIEYSWLPWQRSYNNVINGTSDASAIWAITDERSKELLFSDPIIKNTNVLFFNKNRPLNWASIKDLSGLIIGATNGYFYGEEFQQAETSGLITVERTSIESSNFKKLAANRIDVVIAERDTGYEIMKQVLTAEQIESLDFSQKEVASFTNHLVISKKIENGEALLSTFNKGLKKLTESGKVEQYLMESRSGLYQK